MAHLFPYSVIYNAFLNATCVKNSKSLTVLTSAGNIIKTIGYFIVVLSGIVVSLFHTRARAMDFMGDKIPQQDFLRRGSKAVGHKS
jgi:hypothetical protein